MARWKSRSLTEGELDFMRVLWELGEAPPEEIQIALRKRERELTGGTVRNVLAVMIEKGYAKRSKKGKAYHYTAAISEDDALNGMAKDLLQTAFGGSESLMFTALLKDGDIRTEELEKIERLIDERKKGEGK